MRKSVAGLLVAAILLAGCGSASTSSPAKADGSTQEAALQAEIAKLWSLPVSQRQQEADKIYELASQVGTPIDDANSLLFLYKGPAKDVKISGAFNPELQMLPVEGTDLLMVRAEIPNLDSGTIGYTLEVDGKSIRDPLTHLKTDETLPTEVIYRGDKVKVPPEVRAPVTLKGKTETFKLHSKMLNADRQVTVYLPPDYSKSRRYPVLYTGDAQIFVGRMQTPAILDNMIGAKEIPPVMGVFVDADYDRRWDEYLPDGKLWNQNQQFLITELIPAIEQRYAAQQSRDGRLMMGISNGAALALYTAAGHPNLFRGSVSFSTAIRQDYPVPDFGKAPMKFYLVVGTLEKELQHSMDYLAKSTADRGAKVQTVARPAGHDPVYWSEELVPALKWQFSGQ